MCDGEAVEIAIGERQLQAAYGTERTDTESECGDTDNGFDLLFNWNKLGDGAHTLVASVDGVELGRATFTVTTLGEEFVRDAEGACTAADFPMPGEQVRLVWQQANQNFMIAGALPPSGPNAPRSGEVVGYLENPSPNAFQSGVSVISGWLCEAEAVQVVIEREEGESITLDAAYGTERTDTEEACGDIDNGFGVLFNWNRLGAGTHTVTALADGVALGHATVQVTTLGADFVRGVEGDCVVEDFPAAGEAVQLEWQQSSQNFVITQIE